MENINLFSDWELVKYVGILIIGILGFMIKQKLKSIEEKQDALEHNQNDLRKEMTSYVHKDDFKESKVELRGMFEEIKSDIKDIRNK